MLVLRSFFSAESIDLVMSLSMLLMRLVAVVWFVMTGSSWIRSKTLWAVSNSCRAVIYCLLLGTLLA